MPKTSPEAVIQKYFETANLSKAEVMLELAKNTVKRRQKEAKQQNEISNASPATSDVS